jgi:cytochrome c553
MSTAPFCLRIAGLALASMLATTACTPGADPESGRSQAPSAGLPSGHIAAGQARAELKGKATGQSCIDCHGADGNAPIDATYPKLGGQYADYLAHALLGYRNGSRQHVLMSPQAADLSDQDIADLAAWFASRPGQLRDLTELP